MIDTLSFLATLGSFETLWAVLRAYLVGEPAPGMFGFVGGQTTFWILFDLALYSFIALIFAGAATMAARGKSPSRGSRKDGEDDGPHDLDDPSGS